MKKIIISMLITASLLSLTGCDQQAANNVVNEALSNEAISSQVQDSINNLGSLVENYSSGVAPLIEIPVAYAEDLYNNADSIIGIAENAPIMLREYAATDVVYFDYASDYSVVWDKKNGSVTIEPTDVNEREAFKEKQHK